MRLIVTGAAGFIGSCLVAKLNQEGLVDLVLVDEKNLRGSPNLTGKSFSDYIDKEDFIANLDRFKGACDMVVHMGACTSTTESDAAYLTRNNYLYTRTLAEWSLAHAAAFLYASSAATYGDGSCGYSDDDQNSLRLKPLNLYGLSKQQFDAWVIKQKLSRSVTGFKFFNVFGPNEYHKADMRSLIAKRFDDVVRDKKIQLFKSYHPDYADGQQKRDFIYVKDAVDMVYFFIEHPDKKGIFNVGTGKARSWNDVANALFAALKMPPQIEYIPMPEQLRDKYQYFTQADLTRLRSTGIRHECMSLEAAVLDYVGYLKEHRYL